MHSGLNIDGQALQTILNTVTDVVIMTDHHGNVMQVNQALEQLFGYQPAELIGQNVSLLMPASYAGAHQHYMANYLQTGVPRIIGVGRELAAKHKAGHLLPIHISVTKVEHSALFVGVIRDMSELVKLENEALLASEMERNKISRELVDIENQAILVSEAERNRISRELHDELGQNLMGLSMQLQGITRQLTGSDTLLQQQLQQLGNALLHNVRNIRAIINELATVELEDQGLQEALTTFVNSCNTFSNGVKVNFNCEGLWQAEAYSVEVQLYRIAREAIYNALKHADASRIDVNLLQQDNTIQLSIQDNGKGLPADLKVRDNRLINVGNGLRNIHFRAHVIGAHLTISSSATTGTLIECLYTKPAANTRLQRTEI
ncbi:hypothetical protein WG68_02230 [Arsukibacterium ikkense]|uniref:Sensor protein FixL n=1 Tax=Arsukibacterium ikkense TaxID=336831 RepID=A0A0M2VAZ5_9GAMM|nr:PAS domain S-box protein [Arsukibacterium ikkense]KKO46790.1 hypothetical protein WG68_02230 [Arsukibacterium ikkense]